MVPFQTDAPRPFRKTQFVSVMLDPSRYAAIQRLLSACSPSAIRLAIAFRIVFAVNTHPGWAFAHVGKEILEFQPPLAHLDALATVLGIGAIRFDVTTRLHPTPSLVGIAFR